MEELQMKKERNKLNKVDVYGLAKSEMEVDTDVNEDANREQLLDQSLRDFLDVIKKS
jgi:hypothetical protein